jgi:hypothetical protein
MHVFLVQYEAHTLNLGAVYGLPLRREVVFEIVCFHDGRDGLNS